jgi:signal transduction histidine kinase
LHPDADTDPPRTMLDPSENPTRLLRDTPVTLVFGGRDRWDATPPERLLFSYRVDDGAWSAYSSDTTIVLSDLVPGTHRFEVRAMDRNWNEEPQPALLEFAVIVPWYQETRLVVITAAAGLVALFLGGLAVNRHRQLKRSYAEVGRIVEQRTRELERAQRELFHRQKMTALGTLAAGIAHDFNSILSIVRGSAQIIERNLDDRDKILTRVDRIKTAVEQGSGVVKALLGFSRASDKDSGPCAVSAVVDATLKLLGDRFLQDVRVRYEPSGEPLLLPGAKDLIQQMLLNLVLNAADAMGGEGEIVLQAGRLSALPENLVLSPAPADQYVYLAVKDTGTGIEPDVLPRIFEPFFTTKGMSTRRGTGLGLSMVYQFAKELGFGLRVESEVGRGSTFTILIPLGAKPEAGVGTTEAGGR